MNEQYSKNVLNIFLLEEQSFSSELEIGKYLEA